MRTVKGEGNYKRKSTGEDINFEYTFPVYEGFDELVQALGKDKVLAMNNQTLKEDARNNSAGLAKTANGDSSVKPLTPEQKEANKQSRKADSNLLKLIKAKGLSEADLADLLK